MKLSRDKRFEELDKTFKENEPKPNKDADEISLEKIENSIIDKIEKSIDDKFAKWENSRNKEDSTPTETESEETENESENDETENENKGE